MEAVDTNILIYAHRAESPVHEAARELLERLAEGDAAWGIPVFCLGEFLRVITHPRVFVPPTKQPTALATLEALLASPSLRVLSPEGGYERIFLDILRHGKAAGNRVFDAQIAAVCRQHGVSVLWTNDRNFLKLPGLRLKTIG
jgi:uncharacterized protein